MHPLSCDRKGHCARGSHEMAMGDEACSNLLLFQGDMKSVPRAYVSASLSQLFLVFFTTGKVCPGKRNSLKLTFFPLTLKADKDFISK